MKQTRRFIVLLSCLCLAFGAASSALAKTKSEMETEAAAAAAENDAAGIDTTAINNAATAAANAAVAGQTGATPAASIPGYFSFANPAGTPPAEEKAAKKKQVYYGNVREDDVGQQGVPPDLNTLMALPKDSNAAPEKEGEGLPFDIRRDAIREAAISYGARGGLAWRTYNIRRELLTRSRYLDKIYDFRQFLIPGPSGLMIEPPIITEAMNAMLIESGGQTAAVSDTIYNIINNANIVSAPRNWRSYLERDWGTVEPPPDILRPETDEERLLWQRLVQQGWDEGVKQADEIFQDDLNVLMSDFQGMIRYRSLLAQGMVSPPYALQVDRGVTGNDKGDEMRVGDRAVQITGKPRLITGTEQWQPVNQ